MQSSTSTLTPDMKKSMTKAERARGKINPPVDPIRRHLLTVAAAGADRQGDVTDSGLPRMRGD
jgi:hypothetical protein